MRALLAFRRAGAPVSRGGKFLPARFATAFQTEEEPFQPKALPRGTVARESNSARSAAAFSIRALSSAIFFIQFFDAGVVFS